MDIIKILLSLLVAVAFTGCSDKENEPTGGEKPRPGTYQLSGNVEKGPFVRGSSVSVQPLDGAMTAIGTVFNGEIIDDSGRFDLGEIEVESQFVRIATDGYYFNEVSGELSTGMLHLIATADLSDRNTVNVNILTHLKSARIQRLVVGGKSFAEANRQAARELLTQFGLQAYESIPAEEMSVSAGSDGSGVLIAVSSLILVDRSDAEVTQYLSVLAQDLADDGAFENENIRTIARDRYLLQNKLDNIAGNIVSRYEDLGQSVVVPDLHRFFDWNGDGVAGNEIVDNVEVSLSQSEVSFDKNGGMASIRVTSNIPLSLEPLKDPFGDGIGLVHPGDSFVDFFANTGDQIECESSFDGDVLTVKVAKTQRHGNQMTTVYLYDAMGTVRADVKIVLEGDPSIPLVLSNEGKRVVSAAFDNFSKSLSWMCSMERGYTGIEEFYDVRCPLESTDTYNNRAFTTAYLSVAFNARMITAISSDDATPFFALLNAINYTGMVDKWGRIGIVELLTDPFGIPQQETVATTLHYIKNSLDKISDTFSERSGLLLSDACEAFDLPKDVWRMAEANVSMALGEPSRAMPYLQEIVDSRRYSLSSEDPERTSILHVFVQDEIMQGSTLVYYSYEDVLLLLAECKIARGDSATASELISQVGRSRNIPVGGNGIADIDKLRRALSLPGYFAFQKRNNLGEYAPYQHLWPIPAGQLALSPGWTQNPGY